MTTTATKRTLAEIIQHVADSKYVMGECNCSNCIQKRIHRVFVEASKEVYPSLPFLPRKMNANVAYGDHRVGYRDLSAKDRRLAILKDLRALKKKNNTIKEKLKVKGISGRTYCADCGTIHAKRVGVVVSVQMDKTIWEKKSICPDCISNYFQCAICNTWHSKRNKNSVIFDRTAHRKAQEDGHVASKYYIPLCFNCYDTRVIGCFHCGLYLRESKWIDIGDAVGRSARQFRVDEDGSRIPIGSRRLTLSFAQDEETVEDEPVAADEHRTVSIPGAVLCAHCFDSQSMSCPRCGDTMFRFQSMRDRHGNRVCAQCHDDDRIIHAHNYRPKKFRFKASKLQPDKYRSDTLHYGIELEVENLGRRNRERGRWEPFMTREQMAERILDLMGREDVYVVHDGSLTHSPEGGLEVVSHPMTWEYYRENVERWDELLGKIREWGGQAYRPGTAGLHYHMSKGAFTVFQLYKFTGFFYKKSAQNFVTAIAHRHGHDRYARWNNKDSMLVKKTAKHKYNASGDRYAAINLTNKYTVEARIFRGSLEPLLFHKNMEFLHSLYEYSRDAAPPDMTATKFFNYVLSQKSRFKCLVEFVKYNPAIAKFYPSIALKTKEV